MGCIINMVLVMVWDFDRFGKIWFWDGFFLLFEKVYVFIFVIDLVVCLWGL